MNIAKNLILWKLKNNFISTKKYFLFLLNDLNYILLPRITNEFVCRPIE